MRRKDGLAKSFRKKEEEKGQFLKNRQLGGGEVSFGWGGQQANCSETEIGEVKRI